MIYHHVCCTCTRHDTASTHFECSMEIIQALSQIDACEAVLTHCPRTFCTLLHECILEAGRCCTPHHGNRSSVRHLSSSRHCRHNKLLAVSEADDPRGARPHLTYISLQQPSDDAPLLPHIQRRGNVDESIQNHCHLISWRGFRQCYTHTLLVCQDIKLGITLQ